MPADDEVYGALVYAQKHASALSRVPAEVRQSAALKRVLLWEYLREQAEVQQARAVQAARAELVEWADLAPALAVGGPSAAYNKAKRLLALTLSDDDHNDMPIRRTPEAVVQAERRIAARAMAERRAREVARRQHAMTVSVAERLLENRDGLVQDEEASDWLDEIAAVLPSCSTPLQQVSLSRYMDAAVRALQRIERETALPAACTAEARLALDAAVELRTNSASSSRA
jgi:hypothetical protein